ncbi:MAG: ComEC family competence protein [Marinosulfonomonas sp.]|nr:ComEC family competence protein [Marinosulfonomonas sp.]
MAPIPAIARGVAAQRGYLLHWLPICLAVGIGGYFSLKQEPDGDVYLVLGAMLFGLVVFAHLVSEDFRPVVAALAFVVLGALLAGGRAHWVAEPVLSYRYYGPIEGRIITVDRSASGAVRLTLDRVVLQKMAPARMPTRVRVSLHGQQGFIDPEPGLTVILTGHLSPPSGPTEPGGFDFQRHAWFDGLGGLGYTRTPVLAFASAEAGKAGLFLHRLRMRISRAVQGAIAGEAGAFAAAVMTGDRSGMSRETIDNLRGSNLSHLLAISGLHMGLLTGFIYAALRYGMALIAPLALRWPVRKLAAGAALLVGAAYLALSGGNVATERAFIMVGVMFGAIILDRRALTLRAVALAATIVLVFRPEALPEPGFQMSFAATTALVAIFGALRDWRGPAMPKLLRPVLAVVLSSAVAGLATAPVAAAHFNRIADYGLLANLLSVPLMGLVVMPGAVLAACLAPLGLGWIGLAVMEPAIRWILGVADWVAGLEGAISHVPAPPALVLPALALGALWCLLWRGGRLVRVAGVVPIVLAFVVWLGSERPLVLISDSGGLVGVLGAGGRVVNKPRGEGFVALSWLENDGDGALQVDAAKRDGFGGDKGTRVIDLGAEKLVHLSGRGAAGRVDESCKSGGIIVLAGKYEGAGVPCLLIDRQRLRGLGSVAVMLEDEGVKILGARQVSGNRLWNTPGVRK